MSERSVSLPDPFVSASSTGNRISSLTTRFEKLEVKSQETAQEINGEDAQMDFKMEGGDNDDRFLMPPPPVPTKSLKHASSLPVMSEQFKNSTMHSPVGQRMEDMSMRRSANPQHDLSFVTPRSKKVNGNASPTKKTPKTTQKMFYPSKDSLTPIPAWTEEAIERRLRGFDDVMQLMNKQMEGTTFNHQFLKDTIESQRDQLAELTMQQKNFGLQNESLKEELGELKEENSGLVMIQTELQRNHEIEVDDMERKQRHEVENLREEHRKEVDRLRREASADRDETIRSHRHEVDELVRKHRVELEDMEKRYRSELDEEKARRIKEVEEISQKRDEAISRIASGIGEKEREADAVRDELVHKQADLERERLLRASLESKFSETSANLIALESSNASMKAKINYLESDNQQQSNQFADLHKRMQEAIEQAAIASTKLRAEESVRRKLHNQIQELKGNIRVFCRVRPTLGNDEGPAEIAFPDTAEESKEIIVKGDEKTSALGKVTAANYAFNFDRVFGPRSQNSDVFDEISQLVQSSLDGYNVCIFCYGQTGSGKTHTMSSADGMIPRAVRQIYETAKELEEKGWTYKMTGQFVEVYNENINDLLGNSDDLDKKKHDIKHDMKTCKTTITDVEIMALDSPDMVTTVLEKADKNRSVAATKANMRSSRSHSVFILTLVGENTISGEKCEGTLNLVDLAGSERLAHSQVEGARLKETQSINKSLSCLGDVIGALGQKGEGGHIPYRNSKVSLLQMLMIVDMCTDVIG
jgi:kinesin family protein C1